MHCIELAELASLLAECSPAMLALRPLINQDSLARYWVQSRHRLDQWHRGLANYSALENPSRPVAIQAWWTEHEVMLEEILVSEILMRVFAGLGASLDAARAQREVGPVTHSVYVSHLEARNRVLQLLLFGRGGSVDQTMKLNRLRRASERWTDRLLAPIIALHPPTHVYAIDGNRAIAYAHEWCDEADSNTRSLSAALARSAMKTTLASHAGVTSSMPYVNREIAQAVLSCLPPDCFDSLGVIKSHSAVRIASPKALELQPSELQPIFPTVMPMDHRKGVMPIASRWLL